MKSTVGQSNRVATVSPEPLTATDRDFDEILGNADMPVVVGFCSVACPPCRLQKRLLMKLCADYADRLMVVMVEVEDAPELVLRHHITHIPTQVFFVGGQPVERLSGLSSIAVLRDRLERHASRAISRTA
ncbi:MAG: thioredoxin family protein [candidate division Zixibacteria bacterium]|nr:thioredoxin family protein [candidate division Zixibacteria bacterium]